MTTKCIVSKFTILSFVLCILLLSCALHKNKGCRQFRSGSFEISTRIDGNKVTHSIVRENDIQTETDKRTGQYSKLSVKWIDECRYELLVIETTMPFPDTIQKMRRTIPLKTEIISWTNDYYVFKSYRENSPIFQDTLWVVK